MIRLFRITRAQYLEDFSGLGASYRSGGRWNEAGVPALYFANAPSVAMQEMANYLPSPRLVPRDYRLAVYEMADDAAIEHWSLDSLPADWRDFPYPQSTQRMGSDWLYGAAAPLLAVPSAAVPGGLESIVLANPRCLAPGAIRLQSVESEIFNPRVFAPDRAPGSDQP